jgi:hypothetical protein
MPDEISFVRRLVEQPSGETDLLIRLSHERLALSQQEMTTARTCIEATKTLIARSKTLLAKPEPAWRC